MIAVFRHELEQYFTGLTGYLFGAFLLLFAGIYTLVYNLSGGLSNFEYVLGGMSFVFLLIVPMLTMRVLAEERRQKTDQLLYSLPLSMTEVVLGKYGAMLVVLAAPLTLVSVYPLVLSSFGNVYLPEVYSAMVGFFFLGAALIAIGTFLSSVTESQATAAGLCFVVMLLNYFLVDLTSFVSGSPESSYFAFVLLVAALAFGGYVVTKNGMAALLLGFAGEAVLIACYAFNKESFAGLFPGLLGHLSLFERFYVFLDGMFDVTGLVYLATVAGVFLFLTVQSMEKRRWSE